MAGTIMLVTTALLLLLFWSTHQASAQEPFTVNITVDRTDPPGFNQGAPTEYRAASGPQVVTCTATGGSGSGPTYQWSSTCRDCPFQDSVDVSITRLALKSGDTGTHTCTATRGGVIVNDSIVFNIVGAGIQVLASSSSAGSQRNNGLVRSTTPSSESVGTRRFRFVCRSDSTMPNVGELIGLNGIAIASDNFIDINNSNPGEVNANNRVGLQDLLTASEQGVYTCRIPLQSGEMREINIGIYPDSFDSVPTITNPLIFTPGSPSSTLTCISSTSVATNVTFMREGSPIVGLVRDGDSTTMNGITYQLAQTLTDRRQSTYENVLTITEERSSLVGSAFTCRVKNVLGMSETSQSFEIPDVLTVDITVDYTPPPGFTPGPNEYRTASGPVTVTCRATGGAGSGDYQYMWTSTCSTGCAFRTSSTGVTSVITRTALHSGDIGTHTCTASRGGESASDNVVFKVVDVLTVDIAVDYTPPPGFIPGPNEYRAASGPVTVTCRATGGVGSGDYQYMWTSTCSTGCAFQTSSTGVTSVINRTALHSGDIGTHTCTASRGGESASDNVVFKVVGAGIYVANGVNTGTQLNNGLVIFNSVTSGRRIRFLCRSDSLTLNVGNLIGLDGNTFSGNNFLIVESPRNGGELWVENVVGRQQPLPASEQGIYTCQIPLQSGEMVTVNIGVYPIGFNSGPTINDPLVFTPGSPHAVSCISTGSPATNVTFTRGSTGGDVIVGPLRDGESVSVGGITYKLAQTVTSRRESTYENILTINDELSNLVCDTFTCTVANALGMDTLQSIIIAVEISSPPQIVTVGDTVTFTCTSVLGTAMIEWQDADNENIVLDMDSGVTGLALVLGPVSQSMNGTTYRCRIMIHSSTSLDTVTLIIEDPSVTATIVISGSRVIGRSVTLTCDVTGLNSLANDTTVAFSGPRGVMGTATSLQLSLNPAQFSDAGRYTCVATVTSSLLDSGVAMDTDTEDLRLQIPDPTVSVTHDGGTPLYAHTVPTLTCEINVTGVPIAMLRNIVVSTTWTGAAGNPLSTRRRITVTPPVQDFDTTYISTVKFNNLITGNAGTYTCRAIINPSGFLDDSNAVDADITLRIQLPTLRLMVVPSTTRLPDVRPYNTFNLTCTATAPEGVVTPKAFTWRRAESADGSCDDFTVVGGNIDSNLEQPVSTSVLAVNENNTGTLRFCCQTSIANPDNVSGNPNNVLSIDVLGPEPPMPPNNVGVVSTSGTTATVQWTVPLIVYTPERYVVIYSTGNLKRRHQVLMSDPLESGADFDVANQVFFVELNRLEPNTVYNYQVISENTVGTTASESHLLTTDPKVGTSDVTIAAGVLGALVALLLAYGVIITIVIVVMKHRNRHGRVSIDQPVHSEVEQPAKWSAMTKFGDPDIKTSECVAYSQVQPPSTDGVQDATYEIIGQVIQSQ